MIESLDATGRAFISTVKWNSLREPGAQLYFNFGYSFGMA
jgi:hypothetical protein